MLDFRLCSDGIRLYLEFNKHQYKQIIIGFSFLEPYVKTVDTIMSGSQMNNEPEHKSPRESGEDSEDESEILEESPCGRWLKRREEVSLPSIYFFISFVIS